MHTKERSAETSGRTLDYAAPVYDLLEPLLLLGRQSEYDRDIVDLLRPRPWERILDVGCGTGVLTRMIGDRLDPEAGGGAAGIDAAARMIRIAARKRQTAATRFHTAAAERLPFEDGSFDAAVSSLFFHHVDLRLKREALAEAFRVLRPGGRLVVADMHIPTTAMGWLVSHVARWFFLQPEIGENTRGLLTEAMAAAGFTAPKVERYYFGYIALFTCRKPG